MALHFPKLTTLAENAEMDAKFRAMEIISALSAGEPTAERLLVIAMMQWYRRGESDTLHPEHRRIR